MAGEGSTEPVTPVTLIATRFGQGSPARLSQPGFEAGAGSGAWQAGPLGWAILERPSGTAP